MSHCLPFSFTSTLHLCSGCPLCLEFSFLSLHRPHIFISFRSQSQSPACSQRGFSVIYINEQPSSLPASLPSYHHIPLLHFSDIPQHLQITAPGGGFVAKSCDPRDCSLPGYSVCGILQARILEWVCHFLLQGFPDSGIEPGFPALRADSLPMELRGKPVGLWVLELYHREFLWYNCSAVCGSSARRRCGGVNDDLLHKGSGHRLCDPGSHTRSLCPAAGRC